MTADGALVDSSALPLLRDLEARGCRLTVTADGGRLIVKPASRLTGEERACVREHRHALATLIRVRDDGVQERLVAFEQQFRRGGWPSACRSRPIGQRRTTGREWWRDDAGLKLRMEA